MSDEKWIHNYYGGENWVIGFGEELVSGVTYHAVGFEEKKELVSVGVIKEDKKEVVDEQVSTDE